MLISFNKRCIRLTSQPANDPTASTVHMAWHGHSIEMSIDIDGCFCFLFNVVTSLRFNVGSGWLVMPIPPLDVYDALGCSSIRIDKAHEKHYFKWWNCYFAGTHVVVVVVRCLLIRVFYCHVKWEKSRDGVAKFAQYARTRHKCGNWYWMEARD